MKICITAEKNTLESVIDPRFGRCQYFIIVDTETSAFEAFQNVNVNGMGGVGIQSAQFIVEKGAQAVLTGSVGPNAFQTLQAAGINIIIGVSGTVKEALGKYKSGELKSTQQPNVNLKSGVQGKE